MTVEEFWRGFLRDMSMSEDTQYMDCFHFDLEASIADYLLSLVLDGRKRATCSSEASFAADGIAPPQVGGLCIITDGSDTPRCVYETTRVTRMPFSAMTFDICRREGEDDTLEGWRKSHICFFTAEGRQMGYEFNEDMPVVFEDFRVVYRVTEDGTRIGARRVSAANAEFCALSRELDTELGTRCGESAAQADALNAPNLTCDAALIYVNGQPAACGAVKLMDDGMARVERMYLRPAYKSKELQGLLLSELKEIAGAMGASELIVNAHYDGEQRLAIQ